MVYEVRDPQPSKSFTIHRVDVDGEDHTNNLVQFECYEGFDDGLAEGHIQLSSMNRRWADRDFQDSVVTIQFQEYDDEDETAFVPDIGGRSRRWSRTLEVVSFDRYLLEGTSQVELVQLGLCNPALLEDTRKRISRSFKNQYYHEIVGTILGTIGITDADIQRTSEKQHVVTPSAHPLDIVHWCSGGAKTQSGRYGRWKLWEDNSGVHWKDMIDHVENGRTWEYTMGQDEDRGNHSRDHIAESQWFPGVLWDRHEWNITGQSGGLSITRDILSREENRERVDTSDILTGLRRINSRILIEDTGDERTWSWETAARPSRERISQRIGNNQGYSSATVEIAGRAKLLVGDRIKIRHLDPDGNKVENNSGEWAVRRIRHRLSRDEFTQIVELYRLTRT